jgi:diguanylate cyclase (GGDEF)-like protein/PAS domain S-box-containing protein
MSVSAEREVARLQRMVDALMDRAERSTLSGGTEFGRFQTTVVLEEQVRQRTLELRTALSENQRISRSLRESQAMYEALVDQSLVGIACVEGGVLTYVNPRLGEILGHAPETLVGMRPEELVVADDQRVVCEQLRRRASGEQTQVHYRARGRRSDGHNVILEIHGRVADVCGRQVVISVIQDITEQVRAAEAIQELQAQLREQSTHDALTGLFNRRQLDVVLPRQVQRALQDGRSLAAIMCDLDFFKAVNDLHGHAAGDRVLSEVATELAAGCRPGDGAYRLGGEEFLILLPDADVAVAEATARRLLGRLHALEVVLEDGDVVRLTGSFGVATVAEHADCGEDLLAAADAAVYDAKRLGRDRVCIASRHYPGAMGLI